jgi:hypothetical protein
MTQAQLRKAAMLWDKGMDTWDISRKLGISEADVANGLGAARDIRWANGVVKKYGLGVRSCRN